MPKIIPPFLEEDIPLLLHYLTMNMSGARSSEHWAVDQVAVDIWHEDQDHHLRWIRQDGLGAGLLDHVADGWQVSIAVLASSARGKHWYPHFIEALEQHLGHIIPGPTHTPACEKAWSHVHHPVSVVPVDVPAL